MACLLDCRPTLEARMKPCSRLRPLPTVVVWLMLSTLAFAQEASTPVQQSALPGVPRLVKFSGLLKDSSGNFLSDTLGVTFTVYGGTIGAIPVFHTATDIENSPITDLSGLI